MRFICKSINKAREARLKKIQAYEAKKYAKKQEEKELKASLSHKLVLSSKPDTSVPVEVPREHKDAMTTEPNSVNSADEEEEQNETDNESPESAEHDKPMSPVSPMSVLSDDTSPVETIPPPRMLEKVEDPESPGLLCGCCM